MMRRSVYRSGAFPLVVMMVLCSLLGCIIEAAQAAEVLSAAPLSVDSTATNGMIRVWLSSIRNKSVYDMTVSGAYTVDGTTLSSGSKVRVEFSGGTVYATINGNRKAMGQSVTLSRQSGGVKIAQSLAPSSIYPGDMRFFYSGGTAYVVCYLYIEEYVYGVLPYEMDNSFPLEALKAQAVTARTYAMRAKTSSGVYDVTDTTKHQVFRGVNYGKTNCIRAVDETWGVVLKYGNAYAATYYSASNGGQTEAAHQVWGGSAIPYLDVHDDPYDLSNKRAVRKSYMIYASPSNGSSESAYRMIKNALATKLGGDASQYTINQVNDVLLHTPMYAAPSKLYTRLQVQVSYNGGQSATVDIPIFNTAKSTLGLGINGDKNELFSVERESGGFRVYSRRYGHGVGMSQRGAEQMGESGIPYAQILGFYYPGASRVQLSLSTNWPGLTESKQIPAEAAEQTAAIAAKVVLEDVNGRLNMRASSSEDSTVLDRIPSGSDVTIVATDGTWMQISYKGQTGYVLRQYLVWQQPQAQTTTQAVQNAIVRLESGALNLRSDKSDQATVLGKIENGATVALLEVSDPWARVRYDGAEGYVMAQYLQLQQASTQSTAREMATVSLNNPSETVNLRMEPSLDAPVLALLPQGTPLEIVSRGAEWSQVQYAGQTGHVMSDFLAFSAATPVQETQALQPVPEAQVQTESVAQPRYATVRVDSGKLNLRAQPNGKADVEARIPNGARVEVLESGESWYAIRYEGSIGYVMGSYLVFDATDVAPQATVATQPAATEGQMIVQAIPATAQTADAGSAYVMTGDGDRVNLRRRASHSSTVLIRVPSGEQVQVREYGEKWTEVRYKEYTGFMSTEYLRTEIPAVATQQVASTATTASQPKAAETPAGVPAWIYTPDGGAVNLRKERTKDADALSLIPSGAEVTLLSSDAEWCRVLYRGMAGYVMTTFVSDVQVTPAQSTPAALPEIPALPQDSSAILPDISAEQPSDVPMESVQTTGPMHIYGDAKSTVVNSGKVKLNSPTATLHLKYSADDIAQNVGTLKQHDVVEVLQHYGDRWVFVRKGSSAGYVLAEHIVLDFTVSRVALSDTSSTLTMRAKASSDASAVAELRHDTLLTVIGTDGSFSRVRLADGTDGYVATSYLVPLT